MVGTTYNIPPIPPVAEHTRYVDAGNLSLGVEYRLLDDAELAANYQGEQMKEIQDALDGAVVEDNGVSIHVVARSDGHEYLRFDCFEKDPHYHYIEPSGERQTIVQFDSDAMGDMLDWALSQLRRRLAPMLLRAGGADIAAALDLAALETGVAKLEVMAREAQAELETQKAAAAR